MNEFEKILEENEKILFETKPVFWPFFLNSAGAMIIGIPFLVLGIIFIVYFGGSNKLVFLVPHFLFGLALIFLTPVYRWRAHKVTHYAITNKRVMLQQGIIGRDFQSINFGKIVNASVDVGLLDKLFGNSSGSIRFATAGFSEDIYFLNVDNPYEVFKFFKKTSHF